MLCVQLIFWLGVVASVAIGLGNAGNDLCNAMGVTVGARVLPLWKAVVLGALFDGLGALLMGGRVAHTVGERIVDPALYSDEPLLLAKAMLVCAVSGHDWSTSFRISHSSCPPSPVERCLSISLVATPRVTFHSAIA